MDIYRNLKQERYTKTCDNCCNKSEFKIKIYDVKVYLCETCLDTLKIMIEDMQEYKKVILESE